MVKLTARNVTRAYVELSRRPTLRAAMSAALGEDHSRRKPLHPLLGTIHNKQPAIINTPQHPMLSAIHYHVPRTHIAIVMTNELQMNHIETLTRPAVINL